MDDFTDDRPPTPASRPEQAADAAHPGGDAPEGVIDDPLSTDPGPAWSGVARGPRPPAEGVRIIGAEEAAAAIEAGQVSPRVPDSEPRFGDVPESPAEPRPPLRFPGADPASVSKPPVVVPDPPPAPFLPPMPEPPPMPGPSGRVPSDAPWPDFLGADPVGRSDPSPFWDPPVVATAPRGRFEELVTAQHDLPPLGPSGPGSGERGPSAPGSGERGPSGPGSGEAGPGDGPPAGGAAEEPGYGRPVMPDRQVTPDRPLISDPISGEWAVASGLGGGIEPGGGSRRNLPGPEPAAGSSSSDWDRLTGASPGGHVGDRPWDSFDDSDDLFGPKRAGAAAAAPAGPEDSGTMSLPHWTEPPSGEVPRILPDAPSAAAEAAPDEELSAWSALSTGPRWRDQPADWDEADFHDTVLDDREARLGALRDQPEPEEDEDIFAFDEAAEAPVAATPVRGRGGGQGTATDVRAPARLPGGGGPRGARSAAGPRGGSVVPGGAPPGGPGGSGGSDVSTRVVTGLIAAGVVLAAAAVGPAALVVLVMAAVTMAAAELYQGLRARGYQPATLLGLVGCAAMVLGAYWRGEQAFPLVLSLMVIFSFLWYLTGVVRARPTQNIAVTLFAFVYVGFLGSFASLFLRVPNDEGVGLLLGVVIATAAHDIGAYVVGKYAGKTPLAPELSPNKTFEGLVGGVLASVAISMIVVSQIGLWDVGKAFWLGVVVAVVAPLGDLCESMIKRDLNLKDMGKLLPGHGGVLDRVDALLFVIPSSYYLARLIF